MDPATVCNVYLQGAGGCIIAFKRDPDPAEINEAIVRIRETLKHQFGLMKFVVIQPEEFDDGMKP